MTVNSTAEMTLGERAVCAAPTAETGAASLPVTVIEHRPGWRLVDVAELWRYRELLYVLAWRDIKVRYKQTALGGAWAVLQPFATMVAFSLFFAPAATDSADTVPYPLFVFAGLLPWFFFANAITSASQSIVASQSLVTKVYFPRLLIPMSCVGPALIDFAVAFLLLLGMMAYYGVAPGLGLLLVPLLVLALLVAAVGVGTWLSALTVAYRDFRYVVPFTVQLWMFATPAVYRATTTMGPRGQAWLALNPADGIIAAFRHAVLGGPVPAAALATSCAISLILLVLGCLYFRRVERSFADII